MVKLLICNHCGCNLNHHLYDCITLKKENKMNGFFGERRCLSNFWFSKVEFEGIQYPSNEHAYQAAKTFDIELRKTFQTLTAKEAKKLGTQIALRPDWEEVKLGIMEDLNRQKFQNEWLKEKLLATGDEELVEENYWHDNVWGSCVCKKCGNNGKNNLGKILMKIREELKNAQTT